MDIGVSINPGPADYLHKCALAVEEAGLDILAYPDSQAIDREVYTSLAVSAEHQRSLSWQPTRLLGIFR